MPDLELNVSVYNINPSKNKELTENCRSLKEYMQYCEKVREKSRNMEIGEAVNNAVEECIREGILAEFLKKNRAEAIAVSIYEYDQEAHIKMEREESFEAGKREGMELILELIERMSETEDVTLVSKLSEPKFLEQMKIKYKIGKNVQEFR